MSVKIKKNTFQPRFARRTLVVGKTPFSVCWACDKFHFLILFFSSLLFPVRVSPFQNYTTVLELPVRVLRANWLIRNNCCGKSYYYYETTLVAAVTAAIQCRVRRCVVVIREVVFHRISPRA